MSEIIADLLTYENLIHAVSGMCGGVSAISVFFPLNNVRIRLQVDETMKNEGPFKVMAKIAEKDGWQALYQGWWGSVVSLGASNFVYFYVYNAFKAIYKKFVLKNENGVIDAVTNLAIAAAAGVINVLGTTPLWVVGTRLAVQNKKKLVSKTKDGEEKKDEKKASNEPKPYKGVADCLSRIASEEGLAALWKGVGPSLILVSNPSIQFVTYEKLRAPIAAMAEKRGTPITSLEFFLMGAIAKATATVLTYPLQIAQSRLRADKGKSGDSKERNYKGTADVLQKIYDEAGVKGWYKGMEAKLWQTVLTAAFQFLAYERVQQFVYALFMGKPQVASQ